jgi:mannobiose 2-epimerase
MGRLKTIIGLFIILVILSYCTDRPCKTSDVLSGDYWKEQALKDIIPFWTENSRDEISGAFYTNLDSAWMPVGNQEKYPSMISRHLFSYSVAYLLSGKEEYIMIADSTFKWLISKAWDKEYGGWFDALDTRGNSVQTTKTTFVQVYAITGLAMYYFVTHDSTAYKYIEESNEFLERYAWDNNEGGYFNMMNRDWSVSDSNKSFSSQVTPVSGYLFYLYQATREQKYLDQINKILEVTMKNMVDNESGWILEDFTSNWEYIHGREDASEINIGHNIEAAWMLLRSYLITGYQPHLKSALSIADNIDRSGVFRENGIWLTTTGRLSPSGHSAETYWWIQAYGNMLNLYLYHIVRDSKYLDDFRKGSDFWDSFFMDRKHGDTFFSVDTSGGIIDATKATRFKTSYHSMEQCLLNFLCLNLWINEEPVELYFRIKSSAEGIRLFPALLEGKDTGIQKVQINGKDQTSPVCDGQAILLPDLINSQVKVHLINRDVPNGDLKK